jgi:hypothetical protein
MRPTDPEFRLFSLLSGDMTHSPLMLTQIPLKAARKLGWAARNVFVTTKDAQKIAHHPTHGMDAVRGLALPMVIRRGDYYQSGKRGTDLQVEVILHEAGNPRRAYFFGLGAESRRHRDFHPHLLFQRGTVAQQDEGCHPYPDPKHDQLFQVKV